MTEVSIGYNAYSILTTGKDEYGAYSPCCFVRATISAGTVCIPHDTVCMGTGTHCGRGALPSVLLSLITVYVTYLIGRMVGKNISLNALGNRAVILAVSPWHIYISRLGHEANIGLTLTTLGIFFSCVQYFPERNRHGYLQVCVWVVFAWVSEREGGDLASRVIRVHIFWKEIRN